MGRWSGWGAVARAAFGRPEYDWARDELRELLSPAEYQAALASALNGFYTDAGLVAAIWQAVAELGFTGGQVLEPGCGSGHFVAYAPDSAHVTGVEVEPVTAAIAALLHPHAQIVHESFADTHTPDGTFDIAIGNVPFGDVVLHDPRDNGGRHAIHNHFLLKALRMVRPGGLVAAITSVYTLDAAGSGDARAAMADMADLVGAVRLPTGAHQRAAGTDVVTDVLILQRRDPDTPGLDAGWVQTQDVTFGEHTLPVNTFFVDHPELVLGTMRAGRGLYRDGELVVDGTGDVPIQLGEALVRIVRQAKAAGLTYRVDPERPVRDRPVPVVPAADRQPDGTLTATSDGFAVWVDGAPQPYEPPATQAGDLRALLGLRDATLALLDAEAATDDDTDHLDALRTELNQRYDTYLARFGPINRFDWSSHTTKAGQVVERKIRPGQGGFRQDPHAASVRALEIFDPATQSVAKADIFTRRVVGTRPAASTAATPADAINLCLDRHGELRLHVVAELLGLDPADARDALGTLVFDDPATDEVVLAADYLSSNVRTKLAAARAAAAEDPRFQVNVTALAEVVPHDLPPDQIYARLGGAWVGADVVQQFLAETLEDPTVRVDHPGGSLWYVHTGRAASVVATRQWGIPQLDAYEIAQALLRKQPITISYTDKDRNRVVDGGATAAANDKARDLDERFGEWVWEDPKRATELAAVYNERFNNHVDRTFDGSYLTLPGLQFGFRPHPHQLAAIERIITSPTVGLAHAVGAGKTSEMIIGVMELRRLGLVAKPLVAVPKNVIAQFAGEWMQRYPRARLLVAGDGEMGKPRRAAFLAKAATGDWDAVLMTHQGLERVPTAAETQKAYLQRQVDEITATVDAAKGGDMHEGTIKDLARRAERLTQRIKAIVDGLHDEGITFEQAGFDYVCVDEAHLFKNLMLVTELNGLAITGSQRAADLHMKFEHLRERGGRVGLMATATPFANKIVAEMYNWQRFVDPASLTARGIDSFEQFVATFGVEESGIEVDLVGKLRIRTRLAALVNVPELMAIVTAHTDIKTAADLNLPTPTIREREDGRRLPRTIVVPPSTEHVDLMAWLADRADKLGQPGNWDSILSIGNTGRYAALDLRLVGRRTDETTKVQVVADEVYRIWEATRDNVYYDHAGLPQARTGALQLVFCDLGTPGPKGGPKFKLDEEGERIRLWTLYEQLRTELVQRGMPGELVRFIHEAETDQAKGELFAACNNGQVAVLVASTPRAGIGTNVQRRLVALHHVDPAWRPADIEQRNGRILRQGNQHTEVDISTYVTGRSVDAYMWQKVQNKAHLLEQALRGRSGVRVIDSPDDMVITAGMIKAAAVDNPMLVEQEELKARVAQLERRLKTHEAAQRAYAYTSRSRAQDAQLYLSAAAEAEAALGRRVDTRGEQFAFTVAGHTHTVRAEAEQALHQLLPTLERGVTDRLIGEFGGFPVVVSSTTHTDPRQRAVTFRLDGVPRGQAVIAATGYENDRRVKLVTRLQNRLDDIERAMAELRQAAADAQAEADRAAARIGQPFADQADLDTARGRLADIDAQLGAAARTTTATPASPTVPGSTSSSPPSATAPRRALPAPPPGFRPTPAATPAPLPDRVDRTDDVLAVAVAAADRHGFVSRRDAQDGQQVATADLVRTALTGRGANADALRSELAPHHTSHTAAHVAAVRAWAASLAGGSDYERSLRAVAAADTVAGHQLAMLVSAVGGYLRHHQDATTAEAAAASTWPHPVGTAVNVDAAVVMAAQTRTTRFGESTTVRFVDADGNLYQWSTTTDPGVAVGDHVSIRARVRSHDLWQQRRVTQLTRATLTGLDAQPQPTPRPAVDEGATPVTAPDPEPTAAPDAPASDRRPVLAEVIDIRHWLAGQGGRIPNTPSYLVMWLHELIGAVATDPDLTRMARLGHADEHRRRFAALMVAAVGDGWAAQDLDGAELFERYAHDKRFRVELHATAGIAAYTATRADATLPIDAYLAQAIINPRRQQVLIKAIEDHAPRYHATIGSPARYIAEAHVPGASSAEWNWIAYHIAAHPDVLEGRVLSPTEVESRNRSMADELDRQALSAFETGDHQRALDLIDDAELHDPRRDWDPIRAYVRQHMEQAAPAEPTTPPATGPDAPAAGTAFPHPRQVAGERPGPATAPPSTSASAPIQRGLHR